MEKYEVAAKKIQGFWRRYVDHQIFKYFRNIINFQTDMNAYAIMKIINPKEAELLKDRIGLYIKFRLGGTSFPPKIYYKIFANGPIEDINANAPKDYSHSYNINYINSFIDPKLEIKDSKLSLLEIIKSQNAYIRKDNNHWRCIDETNTLFHLHNLQTTTSNSKTERTIMSEKPKRLISEREKNLRRKQKKVEWMRKMYETEFTVPTTEEDRRLLKQTSHELLKAYDKFGVEIVQDDEVDEIISWTKQVNFDDYLHTWATTATTFK
ncbi:hypothetical protein SNEBB_010684 [Seison nebaliae]|nr:hypothetical protein SNEBB_010684 [Seison nebaliae]